jgi:hypothetical protein
MKTTIWTYWEDPPGLKTPAYIELCFKSMILHCNTDLYEFRLVNKIQLYELLPSLRSDLNELTTSDNARENISIKTDYTRAKLLQVYGGIWIDADSIITQPPPDNLVTFLREYDFIHRSNHDNLAAVNVMGSKPNGRIISEYIKQQDQLINNKKVLNWAENGAHMLTPIVNKRPDMAYSLGLVGSISFPNWKRYFDIANSYVIHSHIWCFQLYNKVFPDWFKEMSEKDILSKDLVISEIYRRSFK